jgi:hypothetical protein
MNFMALPCADSAIYEFTGCQTNYMKMAIHNSPKLNILTKSTVWKHHPAGINALNNNFQVPVFPNPFSSVINITIPGYIDIGKQVNVILFNTLGEQKNNWQIGIGDNKLDLSDLPSGVYFLRIITNSGTITKKIIKEIK